MEADGFLCCSRAQLNLEVVLDNGQAFRWKKTDDGNGQYYLGVANHRLWRIWRINGEKIAFQNLYNFQTGKRGKGGENDGALLEKYFQLDVDLEQLYGQWASRCDYFKGLLAEDRQTFEGIRILRQQPMEALFAFICSANNNIARITKMIEKLCELYGSQTELEFEKEKCTFFDFPTISQMGRNLTGMEKQLRDAGFGYRAASIAKTVKMLTDKEWTAKNGDVEEWLNKLRTKPYQEAKEQLLRLPGIGPKVADCICLMALDMHHVVPVDRHIYNLTLQIYKPNFLLAGKRTTSAGAMTISKQIHRQIGEFYVSLFGEYAGWIQSILFSTRLRRFKKPV